MKAKVNGTKVVFGPVRLSYLHVFEPYSGNAEKAKYQASLLVKKSDEDTVKALNSAVDEAVKKAVVENWKGIKPKNLALPINDGDDKDPADSDYEGHVYVNAKCNTRPGVVDRDQRPLIEGELKSGDYAYVSVTFYGYDVNGNKGIAAGLNNVMKHSDGPALGGRVSAKVDFDDIDASEDDVDDMEEDL